MGNSRTPRLKKASFDTSSATCMASSRVGQRINACGARFSRLDPLDDRQGERRRLARAGLRLADHVLAREQDGDRLRLDRRGFLEAQPRHGFEQLGGETEFGEGFFLHNSLYVRVG